MYFLMVMFPLIYSVRVSLADTAGHHSIKDVLYHALSLVAIGPTVPKINRCEKLTPPNTHK